MVKNENVLWLLKLMQSMLLHTWSLHKNRVNSQTTKYFRSGNISKLSRKCEFYRLNPFRLVLYILWLGSTHTYYSSDNFGLWGLSHIHKVWEKLHCASFRNFLPLFWSRISIANARNLSTKSLIIIVLVYKAQTIL